MNILDDKIKQNNCNGCKYCMICKMWADEVKRMWGNTSYIRRNCSYKETRVSNRGRK